MPADKGDTVLNPFAGSGTTLTAALELDRNAIDINTDYCKAMRDALSVS